MAKYPDRSSTTCLGRKHRWNLDDGRLAFTFCLLSRNRPCTPIATRSDGCATRRTCLATHFSEYPGQNRDRPDLSEELRSVGCRFRKIWLGRHFRRCFRRYLDRFLVRPRIGRRWRNAGRLIRWRSSGGVGGRSGPGRGVPGPGCGLFGSGVGLFIWFSWILDPQSVCVRCVPPHRGAN